MKRILLDVNVVLDVVLDRPPFAEAASALWAAAERKGIEGPGRVGERAGATYGGQKRRRRERRAQPSD